MLLFHKSHFSGHLKSTAACAYYTIGCNLFGETQLNSNPDFVFYANLYRCNFWNNQPKNGMEVKSLLILNKWKYTRIQLLELTILSLMHSNWEFFGASVFWMFFSLLFELFSFYRFSNFEVQIELIWFFVDFYSAGRPTMPIEHNFWTSLVFFICFLPFYIFSPLQLQPWMRKLLSNHECVHSWTTRWSYSSLLRKWLIAHFVIFWLA